MKRPATPKICRRICVVAGCLLGLSLLAAPVKAISYAAGLVNSEWHVRSSELECRLWQPVPGFGEGIFSKRAGQGLSFVLKSSNGNLAPGTAILRAEGAIWKPMVEPQLIGEVEVTDALIPVQIPRLYAEQMLASLNQGLMPTISTQSDIALGFPAVKVAVSTVNFPEAYSQYQHCLTNLLPVNYQQIARSTVFYETGEASLSPDVREYLDLIARYVKADKEITRVVIDGHTDSFGDKQANYQMSRQRANIVMAYFQRAGISSKQILVRYHGDKYPAMPNDSEENRARNRRVTIRLDRT